MTGRDKKTSEPPADSLQPQQQMADDGSLEGGESFANIEPDGAQGFADINPDNA